MNKETLKEMFNFTKNKKETIIIGIILVVQLILYTFSYPFIMQKVVDEAIPEENIGLVILLSVILFSILQKWEEGRNLSEEIRCAQLLPELNPTNIPLLLS